MKTKLHQILVLLTFTLTGVCQTPYSSWELGIYGGESYYLGELNQTHFQPYNLSFGPRLRYNFDQRIGLKGLLTIGEISADDANSKNSFNRDRNFAFTSQLIEGAIVGEFNFDPYSALDSKSRLATPFLFLGGGFTKHNPKAQLNGILLSTQGLQTEGVNFKKNILSIPIGVGYKIMANRFGFEFTWGIRKTNSDYLDDAGKKYELNLKQLISNDRFFSHHNTFYDFSHDEIISILSHEMKLFENILQDSKPDFLIMFQPSLRHEFTFYQVCKKSGVIPIIINPSLMGYRIFLSDEINLSKKINLNDNVSIKKSFKELQNYYH